MPNPCHIAELNQGVESWNRWRRDNLNTEPDLCDSVLDGMDLEGADLNRACLLRVSAKKTNLNGATLREANCSFGDFTEADIRRVDARCGVFNNALLSKANLESADLTAAKFLRAHLGRASLRSAVLAKSQLVAAHLCLADCEGADFTRAVLGETVFAETMLHDAIGLATCRHIQPSSIDHRTIARSKNIPLLFLRACGLPDALVQYLPSILNRPISFYSCFVSYSHKDRNFAHKLYDALQRRGIQCWLDEKDLLPGDDLYEHVDRGIRSSNKVLLCCSAHSLSPGSWVDKEITAALEREDQLTREAGRRVCVLIPLNLDGHLFSGSCDNGCGSQLRRRLVPDFTGWQTDEEKFNSQVNRVIEALSPAGQTKPELSRAAN